MSKNKDSQMFYDEKKIKAINEIVKNLSIEYWPFALYESDDNYKMIQPTHFHKSFIIFMAIVETKLNDTCYQKLQEIEEIFAKFHLWLCNNQYIGENYTPKTVLGSQDTSLFKIIEVMAEIIFIKINKVFQNTKLKTNTEQDDVISQLDNFLETLTALYESLPKETEENVLQFNNFLFKILDYEQ